MFSNLLYFSTHQYAILWLPVLAVFLDIIFADPQKIPHPVQAVGFFANKMEGIFRPMGRPLFGGTLAALLVAMHIGIAVGILLKIPFLGQLAAIYLCWSGLALGGLLREGHRILALLESDSLEQARQQIQMLVSRDASALDEEGIRKALAETVAENLNDAFIAPFFWLLVTGPVGLWLYKAFSTLDSMWGYKTEKWLYFGRFAARADDVLAFIPARLTALFLFCTASMVKLVPNFELWKKVSICARLMSSPNAGWPMSAAAWLHSRSVGGPTVYDGKLVQKPVLGPEEGIWTNEALEKLLRHILFAGLFGAAFMWVCSVFLLLVFF